ncbi:hypothetical protein JJC00_06610 [Bradyrhizobium diazoefficiens]|uniref:hypothetical protein n=1 Tax=Bradyrhizobium diazoefficiens TaxID=1355477 RepID=UPI00190C480B|nr:hypothetical protein [Bradyrhizobium diazoefficiens]QQO35349.1 hypothetical protein JJC00_06610 [Bradyrhizobium diazoefficiens]
MIGKPLNSDEVSDEQKKLVDDIIYLRGRIITSYSQVEFLLADIAVKLELKFPYRIEARLKAAKRIAEREGFETYKAELDEVCDGLAQFDDVRKFMAHGWANLEVDKQGNHRFELRMYERTGEGQFELMSATSTCERLLEAANDINAYTAKVINLFHRIYCEKGLEKPE